MLMPVVWLTRTPQMHLFWGLLLGLTASLATNRIVRIAESREGAADPTADYTGQIRQFSEIGPSGSDTVPRPWVCYTDFNPFSTPIVQWQTPNGSVVPMIPSGFTQANGSQLYQVTTPNGPALIRGPDYNSPDGEYCCVIPIVPGQRRCVTLTTCPMLPFPANGMITYDPATNVATHRCDPGYVLNNTGQRTCQSNNQWSGATNNVTVCEFFPLSVQDILTNNSLVFFTAIGEGASALTCHTELTTCCREQDNPSGGALGEWTGPHSNQIPESSTTSGFYVTRQQSSISLNRGGHSTVGGQYCCVIPRTGGEMTFCVNVQMKTTHASCDHTVEGLFVTIATLLVTAVISLVILLSVRTRQLQEARTQLSQQDHNKQHDRVLSKDRSEIGTGRAGDHTHTPAMKLSQCPAYSPTKTLTGRDGRGDVGEPEEGIYED